jgi:hypothetical protein
VRTQLCWAAAASTVAEGVKGSLRLLDAGFNTAGLWMILGNPMDHARFLLLSKARILTFGCREGIAAAWFAVLSQSQRLTRLTFAARTIFVFAANSGISTVPAWEKDVRNPRRTLARELSAADQQIIRPYYRYDLEMSDHLLSVFPERLGRIQFGGDFADCKLACAGEYKDLSGAGANHSRDGAWRRRWKHNNLFSRFKA